jgi:hypothetical protein
LERNAPIPWGKISPHKFRNHKYGTVYDLFLPVTQRSLDQLDYFRTRFFWQGDSENKKYRLTKWTIVCDPKDQGGLGVHGLEVKTGPC